jgi:predicted nuclease of predicted toxin-antitoxin system
MLLLDQGLPRSTTIRLSALGLDAEHVGDCGLATADDQTILDYARRRGHTIVTLDADFHKYLALSRATTPSVIRIRIEGLKAEQLAALLVDVLDECREDLSRGAVISATETRIRLRNLPLLP